MEKKICTKCNQEKLLEEFSKKTQNSKQSWCRKCLYESQKIRWKNRKRKAIELFGSKCCKCGYNKNLAALEFHHLDPFNKKYDWKKLRECKWEIIIDELKKCILVCANCHDEIHAPEQNLVLDDNGNSNGHLNINHKYLESTGKCPECDSDVYGTKFCSVQCSSKFYRKVKDIPCKTELLKMIEEMSYCAIGRKYNVSDNAVRKWAKRYGIL